MADFYDEDQVTEILRQALTSRSHNPQKLSREQVGEIAAELGVSPEDFVAAEEKWQQQQSKKIELSEFDSFKQHQFREGALKYVLVNAVLAGFNLFSSGQIGWVLYLVMFWGLGVSLDAWATYQKNSAEYAKQFQKWQRQRQRQRFTDKLTDKVTSTVSEWLK